MLTVCGVNHKTAPVELRERLAFLPEQMPEPLLDLLNQTHANEGVILSTCNRMELYCDIQCHDAILNWLSQRHDFPKDVLTKHMYFHHEEAAIRHMIRVASGLDSMVLGEAQIFGQVKHAYQIANTAGTLGPQLNNLFQYVFSVSKQIRSETGIGANAVSIAFAAVTMAKHIFSKLNHTSALVIGAGETIELVLQHLRSQNVCEIIIANRTLANAEILAAKYDTKAISIADIPSHLQQSDIVISATASPLPILGKGSVESALKFRKHKPMLMVDLGVPRNIEPETNEIEDVYLYSLDDLQQIIAENIKDRQYAAHQAEGIIQTKTELYMRQLNSQAVVETICSFRNKVEHIREQELAKAMQQIQSGMDFEETLQTMAHVLTNKIMHLPTIKLRQAGLDGDDRLIQAVRQLFDLDDNL